MQHRNILYHTNLFFGSKYDNVYVLAYPLKGQVIIMLVVSYGRDIAKITYETLTASDIAKYLKPSCQVSLKPNLVVPGPASNGAVTHPEVCDGIIRFLKDFGVNRIKIIESSWVGDDTARAFRYCGYEQLSQKYSVPLIDLKKDKYTTLSHSGYDIKVCNEALETDFLINIPVLKAHCQTRLTCCMKNLKGCIPDSEKRRFHTLGLHKPIAVLNALIKTGYCVVDGICGDLTFEEGGNPVTSNRIIAGRNPLTLDSYCASLIGYHPDEIGYLSFGRALGLGEYWQENATCPRTSSDFSIIELGAENKPLSDSDNMRSSLTADRYRTLIDEDSACSACYSSLIYALHRLGGRVGGRADTSPTSPAGNKIHIGQGFKGKCGAGIGIGNCAKGFEINVKGCPPTAKEIIDTLR